MSGCVGGVDACVFHFLNEFVLRIYGPVVLERTADYDIPFISEASPLIPTSKH